MATSKTLPHTAPSEPKPSYHLDFTKLPNIPSWMKDETRWFGWKYEWDGRRWTKRPYNVHSGQWGKSNDSSTWATFENATDAVDPFDATYNGIGFSFYDSPYVGIDLDNVVVNGQPEPFALAILELLSNPYSEFSPSRSGLHTVVTFHGVMPKGHKVSDGSHYGAEIYDGTSARYFTVSGDKFAGEGAPEISQERMEIVHFLLRQFGDAEFKHLWLFGDEGRPHYGNDKSASGGDFQMVRKLMKALATKDPAVLNKYFQASLRVQESGRREKWDRLGAQTIANALKYSENPNEDSEVPAQRQSRDRSIPRDEDGLLILPFQYPPVPSNGITHVLDRLSGAYEKDKGWFRLGQHSILGGSSGTGKTTWLIDQLKRQENREPVYGHPSHGLRYLVISCDRDKEAADETFDRMDYKAESIPVEYMPMTLIDDQAVLGILKRIEKHGNTMPEIVFIEGADGLVTDASDARCVALFVEGLRSIAHHYNLAVISSVGAPKLHAKDTFKSGRDNIFGSQMWTRKSDAVITMHLVADDVTEKKRTISVHLRNAPTERFNLVFKGGRLTVDTEAEIIATKTKGIAPEIEWFKRRAVEGKTDPTKKWFTTMDVEMAFDLSHATAARHVKDAYTKDYIEKRKGSKKGKGGAEQYRWDESPSNPLWVEEQAQTVADAELELPL